MKLIIDVDTGTDDAEALMLALRCPDAELLAVTCVGGNVPLDIVVRNTRLVVAAAKRPDQPMPRIFAGASLPLVSNGPSGDSGEIRAQHYHHSDGVGGAWETLVQKCRPEIEAAINSVPEESTHAAQALIDIVSKHKGEVTLLALAPLTNVALALQLEPRLGGWLRGVVIMGGAYQSVGNNERYLSAEFNFVHDPEAARIVLHELLPCPRLLVPYEVCLDGRLPFDWTRAWAASKQSDSPEPLWRRLLSLIVSHQLEKQTSQTATRSQWNGFRSCDLLAASICLNSEIATDVLDRRCTIELAGSVTRGQLVVDWFNKFDSGVSKVATAPTRFATKVDLDAYRSMLEQWLG